MPTPDDKKPATSNQPFASSELVSKGCGWGIVLAILLIVITIVMTKSSDQVPDKSAAAKKQVGSASAPRTLPALEQQQLEVSNKAKIDDLKAGVKTLSERDYEGRLIFWKEIFALAPANASYAEEVRKAAAEVARHDYARPEDGASIEMLRPQKVASGNVLVIDVTIRNDSLSNLKDFQITCENKGNSGTTTDTKRRVLYEIIEARTSRTFRNINMGLINNQAAKTDCRIASSSVA